MLIAAAQDGQAVSGADGGHPPHAQRQIVLRALTDRRTRGRPAPLAPSNGHSSSGNRPGCPLAGGVPE
jgi:hypothetical protein